jgi:hypothetical protein
MDKERLEAHLNNGKKEHVMCAAIRIIALTEYIRHVTSVHFQPYNVDDADLVLCGWRHASIFQQFLALTGQKITVMPHDRVIQGFLTDKNRFLTREEALELVKTNGQLPDGKLIGGVLTSEDLW